MFARIKRWLAIAAYYTLTLEGSSELAMKLFIRYRV